jgi:hypothetical protein
MISRRALPLFLLLAATACFDSTGPEAEVEGRGLVVLHAYGALPGITETDSAKAGRRFALPPEFDGARMRISRDTVLTTSSGFSGDNRLYVASLSQGTLLPVEMPARSLSAGAALAGGFRGAQVVVAHRGTSRVGLVTLGASPSVATLDDVGLCPYDVSMFSGFLLVLDQNAACGLDYSSQGESRLIIVPPAGIERDTIPLGVEFASNMLITGGRVYVSSLGVTTYDDNWNPTFVTPGAITVVDLATGQVLGTGRLPQGTSGADMRLGLDGRLYVTAYLNTSYETGTFQMELSTLEYRGTRVPGGQNLRLVGTDGQQVHCAALTADRLGRLYCALNQGASASTTMVVFTNDGTEIRRFSTGGTGAVDIGVR